MSDFNVGSDTRLNLLASGLIVKFAKLTGFSSKQMTNGLESEGIDGVTAFRDLEKGWEGDFDYDRASSVIDDFFAAKEAARYAGQQPPVIQISQTIRELNGTKTKYRFEGVTLKYDSAGKWEGNKKVEQKISFKASRRYKAQ